MARAPLAKGDDGSGIRYTPRKACPDCGLEHREICPSSPAVAAILWAPMPERFDPPCEGDE